ncbi:Thiosulfate sulfurtransferase GlpE [Hypsizygus marmoreus]|uniref:Thiosulfate sulfurtransferase GlpE n=1 Tax=Hypsizygus marmoreus TaxID=39966 RepID=A0A369JHN5_HYPMA|nr:Thiosulfate sulfurtransferase GlpE [Hypsizygus marmoreus]
MISDSYRSTSTRSGFEPGGAVSLSGPERLRTLDDVRSQVAHEVGVRAITHAKVVDGVRIGVSLTLSKPSGDLPFLQQAADTITHQLSLTSHLFILGTTSLSSTSTPLLITGSSHDLVERASLLVSAKFTGRVQPLSPPPPPPPSSSSSPYPPHSDALSSLPSSFGFGNTNRWTATIIDLGASAYDEDALWDTLLKAAHAPMDPEVPPPHSHSIDAILAARRAQLQRITPKQAYDELREPVVDGVGAPTFLVDIRPEKQRGREGGVRGALVVERNVLEWRFDPRCEARLAVVDRYDLRVIVFCQEGYTSSLAAYALQELGLLNATDIIGGFKAWKEAGLPVYGGESELGTRPLSPIEGSVSAA